MRGFYTAAHCDSGCVYNVDKSVFVLDSHICHTGQIAQAQCRDAYARRAVRIGILDAQGLLAGLKGNREIYSGVRRVVAGEDEVFGGVLFLAFAAVGIYSHNA